MTFFRHYLESRTSVNPINSRIKNGLVAGARKCAEFSRELPRESGVLASPACVRFDDSDPAAYAYDVAFNVAGGDPTYLAAAQAAWFRLRFVGEDAADATDPAGGSVFRDKSVRALEDLSEVATPLKTVITAGPLK